MSDPYLIIMIALIVLGMAAHEILEQKRHVELKLLLNLLGTFIGERDQD